MKNDQSLVMTSQNKQEGPVPKSIGIHFGALCDPIGKQLEKQGCVIPEKDCERFQKIADAITMLHLHGMIPDSITYKAHQKLMKKISKAIHRDDIP